MTVGRLLLSTLLAVFFSTTISSAEPALENLEAGLNELIYDLSQSIVTIEAIEPVYPNNVIPGTNNPVYNVVSTGLIYDTLGHIITSASAVIGRSSIMIKFGNIITSATLKAVDYQSGLALLLVDKKFGNPIRMSSAQSCAGQMVMALGNAFGLRASPSLGFCAGFRPDEYLQFSASFPSGTIGGGLFTLGGQLVGMISGSVGQYGSNSIGLALPARQIALIVDYLLIHGNRDAGYLGLSTTEIEINPPFEFQPRSEVTSVSGNQKETISSGVIVTNVIPNSPAEKAGLVHGDILFRIENSTIYSALKLAQQVKTIIPGLTIEFDMIRHNRRYKVSVPVGSYAKQSQAAYTMRLEGSFTSQKINDSLQKELEQIKKQLKSFEEKFNRSR